MRSACFKRLNIFLLKLLCHIDLPGIAIVHREWAKLAHQLARVKTAGGQARTYINLDDNIGVLLKIHEMTMVIPLTLNLARPLRNSPALPTSTKTKHLFFITWFAQNNGVISADLNFQIIVNTI